jgi:hypothetical protein
MQNHEKQAATTTETPTTSGQQLTKKSRKRLHEETSADMASKNKASRQAEFSQLQREIHFPTFILPEHEEIYRENWAQIQTRSKINGRRQRMFNVMLESASFQELETAFRAVHQVQAHQYKVNYAFGFVLYNNVSGQRRYYHASNNTRVLERPMLIQNESGLNSLLSILGDVDVLEYARQQRPNSRWMVELVTNVLVYVYPLHTHPIGTGQEPLPQYIKNNRSIITLDSKKFGGGLIQDNLCFFRCLALHRGYSVHQLERPTVELFLEYCTATDLKTITIATFVGVMLHQLQKMEDIFHINIQVYALNDQAQAELIRRSVSNYRTTLYLNLHEKHFSYIKDFKSYSRAHKCRSCDSVFELSCLCIRHEKTCQGKTKFVFPGGVFKPPASVFTKMERHGIQVPPVEDQFYPYRGTYDIECYMDKVEDKTDTEKLSWIATHRVASVSVCSNIPGYTDAKCFVSTGNESQLVGYFVDYINKMAECAHGLVENKYKELTEAVKQLVDKENSLTDLEVDKEDGGAVPDRGEGSENDSTGKEHKRKGARPINTISMQFERWKKQLPIIGFNSSKYDVNAMRSALFPALIETSTRDIENLPNVNVIKKQNNYMAITTDKLSILDILNYLSPNTTYAKFLKSFKVEDSKGHFPYEWFTDLSKLNTPKLPGHNAFYSELKKCNITDDEYTTMQKVWNDEHMTSMHDFLIWYNNQDVKPFMEAIDKMCSYFKSRGLDLFKDGISLPGLAMKDLFSNTGTFFTLFGQKDCDLYHRVREEIVGGPSIIFNRHQEKDKTFIRKHTTANPKICKGVAGFDANALYLWALSQPMPTGFYNRRKLENNFKLERAFQWEQQAYEWLAWKQHTDDTEITHRHKDGHEIKIGPKSIPVDGFSEELNKTYQFQGCLFHGHSCWLTHKHEVNPINKIPLSELRKKTEETTRYLKDAGYQVEEIYECQWKKFKSTNKEVKIFLDHLHSKTKWSRQHKKSATTEEILKAVRNDELFGIVECDIHVPESKLDYFDEMSPIFKNTDVSIDDIGDHMRDYALTHDLMKKPRRMTVGSLFGEKIMLITPLLKWYLNHGLVCSKIYQIIEYTPMACFEKAGERVSNARRQGDADPDKSILAEMEKLFGNSYYGKTVTNKEKHTKVKYYIESQHAGALDKSISRNSFLSLTKMAGDTYEIISTPQSIKLDLPLQLGFFVYGYAKLRMLEFYYDFMCQAFDKSDFEYCEMDTDSAYIAFSGSEWKELLKPPFRAKYEECMHHAHELGTRYNPDNKLSWFPRDCCDEHRAFDKRTPGLFKLEWSGAGIIGLCSKTYFCFGHDTDKHSCKGIQQKRNQLTKEHYFDVLSSQQSGQGVNRGFRVVDDRVLTYEQVRSGLSYFYPKRKVQADGISTVALLI